MTQTVPSNLFCFAIRIKTPTTKKKRKIRQSFKNTLDYRNADVFQSDLPFHTRRHSMASYFFLKNEYLGLVSLICFFL